MVDAQAYCGGQAFSIDIDEKRYGAKWMNQGVQGGSYIYQYVQLLSCRLPACQGTRTRS